MIKKPMKGEELDIKDIDSVPCPVAMSPKIDGIRCLKKDSKALSASFKEIPNRHTFKRVSEECPEFVDGELKLAKSDEFNDQQSAFMSRDGEPEFEYWVFDYVENQDLTVPYMKRMAKLAQLRLPPFCKKVLPVIANSPDEIRQILENWLNQGFEGAMIRSLNGPYKCGKATVKQGWLLKLKPTKDSEAKIVGFEEMLHNENEPDVDELGRTKRSKSKDGLVPGGTLGKFIVEEVGDTPWRGQQFAIGGGGQGLTKDRRKEIWENRDKYLGKLITYKYQEIGTKDLPRQPIFKWFRDERDMS